MKTLNVGVVMDQGADFNLVIGVRGVSGPIDLTGYSFLGDMRLSTDPTSPVAGGVAASGKITLTANPAPADTLTINGIVITFVAATPVGNQVLIGSTVTMTACNLLQFLKLSVNPSLVLATYVLMWPGDVTKPVINVTAAAVGVAGNAFTLAAVSASITVSAATLLGGIEPARFIFTILDQALKKGQVKWFLPLAIVNTIAASVSNDLQTQRLKTPYVFDIKMKDTAGAVTRIIQGIVYLSPQSTQEVLFP